MAVRARIAPVQLRSKSRLAGKGALSEVQTVVVEWEELQCRAGCCTVCRIDRQARYTGQIHILAPAARGNLGAISSFMSPSSTSGEELLTAGPVSWSARGIAVVPPAPSPLLYHLSSS